MNQEILAQANEIMRSRATKDEKYDALDQLYLSVLNRHPDGLGAAVLETISYAQTIVLYPDWKGGDAERVP